MVAEGKGWLEDEKEIKSASSSSGWTVKIFKFSWINSTGLTQGQYDALEHINKKYLNVYFDVGRQVYNTGVRTNVL